jgi:hypothetical protein
VILKNRQKGQFERPVPDATNIGAFQRGTISDRDRSDINRTLPPGVDREKVWAELEPMIKETRSPQQIVEALKIEIRELESAKRKVTQFIDGAAIQRIQAHIAELRGAQHYYEDLAKRPRTQARFKRFRIFRAWSAAGGRMTVSSPDNPDGTTRAERRGRGTPGGKLIEYFRVALRIICGDDLTPEAVKSLLYCDYKKYFHFQLIGACLQGVGSLNINTDSGEKLEK